MPLNEEVNHNHHITVMKISVNGYEHRVWKSLQRLHLQPTRQPCILFVAIHPDEIDAATPAGERVDEWGTRAFLANLLDSGYTLTYERPTGLDEEYDQRLIEQLEVREKKPLFSHIPTHTHTLSATLSKK